MPNDNSYFVRSLQCGWSLNRQQVAKQYKKQLSISLSSNIIYIVIKTICVVNGNTNAHFLVVKPLKIDFQTISRE